MINKGMLEEAIRLYGKDIVYTVMEVVAVSDADGAYTMFEDLGHYDHAEVVALLYFENN